MKEERVVELAKTARIVSETYDAHTGNWSWPRLKAFEDLIESDIRAELTPRKLPDVKSLEEFARDYGDERRLTWVLGEYDDTRGYDCMTGGIRVGPALLDGYVYGQQHCEPISQRALDRMEADARLIAAAPELLDALKDLQEALDNGFGQEIGKARYFAWKAIAKATGEK